MALPNPFCNFRQWLLPLVGMTVCGLALVAILFPVFAEAPARNYIYVRDHNGKPIKSGVIRFRDRTTGRMVATFDLTRPIPSADAGRVMRHVITGRYECVDYAYEFAQPCTGANHYQFSPYARYVFRLVDAKGKPLPNTPVGFSYSWGWRRTWSEFRELGRTWTNPVSTDAEGRIFFDRLPAYLKESAFFAETGFGNAFVTRRSMTRPSLMEVDLQVQPIDR